MLPLHTRFPCPLLVTTALGKNVSVRDNYHFLHKNTRPQYFIYHVRNIWLTIGDNGLQNSNEKFSLYLAFWIYYLVNLLTLQGMGYFEDTDRRKGRVLNGGCWVIPSITWKIGFPPIKAFVPPPQILKFWVTIYLVLRCCDKPSHGSFCYLRTRLFSSVMITMNFIDYYISIIYIDGHKAEAWTYM